MREPFENFYFYELKRDIEFNSYYDSDLLIFIFKSDNPNEWIEICVHIDEYKKEKKFNNYSAHYYHRGDSLICRISKKDIQRLLDKYEKNYRIDLLML
jgi:hypothetical protein